MPLLSSATSPSTGANPLLLADHRRGRGYPVVAACSYEARRFGIHSADAGISHAYRLCPQAIFLRPRFDVYKVCSGQIRDIFRRITPLVEPLSLDEAYLDVSDVALFHGSATLIAGEIKLADPSQELDLTASAGVSYNKFLAKIASDMDKPDGLYVIRPEQAQTFINDLPVRKFYGVGEVTERKMHSVGIFTGSDLREWREADLTKQFGKSGKYYYFSRCRFTSPGALTIGQYVPPEYVNLSVRRRRFLKT